MIKASFVKKNGVFSGFSLSGHSGYARCGEDIVCAAVSSAAMLTVNTVTDFFGAEAEAGAEENKLYLNLIKSSEVSEKLIESFYTHLKILSEQYKGTIKLKCMEV